MARKAEHAGARCARVGGAVAHPADNRVGGVGGGAGVGKAGLAGERQRRLHEHFRRLVAASPFSRQHLAEQLGVKFRTLEKWLSDSEDQHAHWTVVADLLSRRDLVGEPVRTEVAQAVAREWGFVLTPTPEVEGAVGAESVRTAALGAAAGAGRVAAEVAAATRPESDGGVAITAAEGEVIAVAAGAAQRALQEVINGATAVAGTEGAG